MKPKSTVFLESLMGWDTFIREHGGFSDSVRSFGAFVIGYGTENNLPANDVVERGINYVTAGIPGICKIYNIPLWPAIRS